MTPAKPRILVTRRLPGPVQARLAEAYAADLNDADVPLDRATLVAAMRSYDALVPTITDRIDADLLTLPGRTVRMIANFGAGTDHIDLGAAREAGIIVSNTPGALTETTAELAILLILMAMRRAGEGERELRAGRWTGWRPTHLLGHGLAGKTLGLIGFGRIAQATARRARALGMEVQYVSRTPAGREVEAALGARRARSLEALAAWSDVVSLHVPGGPETHHLIDRKFLAQMRPHAILINTARGSVVNEAALAEALDSGVIAGAGLDVFEQEPAVHPALLGCERAVLLPHLGSATWEARIAMGMQAADNLDAHFSGRDVHDRVS
ncbi:D-glycerate dehydrogenase [Novosphingobium sp.]|uniref:2-hydroxyacid dehydrogenase n=1 Tax=Novosphingobium sp. TaxID=1874826 RepID=UPI00260FCD04|nr:D-glycerate dehydrogenase [Novosphingobium sp.]